MVDQLKQIVRVAHTDIMGNISLYHALTRIRGVGYSFANAICNSTEIERTKKIGALSDQELNKIDECIKDPKKYHIPEWLVNRKRDNETGLNLHLTGPALKLRVEQDIKNIKRLKTYKGVRHSMGQPVRGQRTKAHFRKGTAIGVQRSKAKMAPPKKEEGKK